MIQHEQKCTKKLKYNKYRVGKQINITNIEMQEQKPLQSLIPEDQIVSMIEQFIGCLNYPNTKATLAKQKHKYNLSKIQKNQQIIVQENQIQQSEKKQVQHLDPNFDQGMHSMEQIKIETKEPNQLLKDNQSNNNTEKQQQFRWKGQQAKFYSKFASFSQIVYCLETSSNQRQLANIKLIQNQISQSNSQVRGTNHTDPSLLYIFSAFDASSKVRQFTIPIYRTLSLEPKFSKPLKLMEACPKQNILCIVDESSTVVMVNLLEQCLIQFMRIEQSQSATAIKWLKTGSILAIASKNGKINIYSALLHKSLDKIITLNPHSQQITCMYCTKDYLYTCSSDFTLACIYIRSWKVEKTIKLKGNYLVKMTKVNHKKLKDIIFGIQKEGQQLVMIDEITGFTTTIFSIKRNHIAQCRKIYEKKDQKMNNNVVMKSSWISDILTNHDNSSLIVSVAGVNPSVYEVDPLRNQCNLRLNYKNLKTSLMPIHDVELSPFQRISNIHIGLYHKSEILIVTTNSNSIFYVRIKNWRILHEYVEQQKGINFGMISATRRYPEADQSSTLQYSQMQAQICQPLKQINIKPPKNGTSQRKHNQAEKQSVLCIHNTQNNNIQVYYNQKGSLKTIRSEMQRSRPLLSHAFGLTNGTQGFLELLQTIRQNYQAFNT